MAGLLSALWVVEVQCLLWELQSSRCHARSVFTSAAMRLTLMSLHAGVTLISLLCMQQCFRCQCLDALMSA